MCNTVVSLFEKQARKTPGYIAVSDESRALTYAELDCESSQLAAYLNNELNVDSNGWIGLIVDHSVEMIVSIMAILKTGNGYVPLEPDFPRMRIQYILEASHANVVITQQKYASQIDDSRIQLLLDETEAVRARCKKEVERPSLNESSPCYVLFTSGTTGTPKGVIVEQRNVVHYVNAFCSEFHPDNKDVMLQNSVCTFDIFVEEIFPILTVGGRLVIPTCETRNNQDKLIAFIENKGVTMVSGFPYLLNDLNKLDKLPSSLRLLISGGDVLRKEYVTNLIGKVEIYNTYGPTETTVCATYYRLTPEDYENLDYIPIGKPINGTGVIIMDDNMSQVMSGEVGEFCIVGEGVSLGYLDNPSETERLFVSNPLKPSERMYKSGDMGLKLESGDLLFKERRDDQVMIVGKRVEPAEVEQVLTTHPEVDLAVVKSFKDKAGYAYLVAYITLIGNASLSSLKEYLLQFLPSFMIPEFWMILDEMPLTLNGKVDRKSLAEVLK